MEGEGCGREDVLARGRRVGSAVSAEWLVATAK